LLPLAAMVTTSSSIEAPKYGNQPFFSNVFSCPIAIGSFFIFKTPADRNKKLVGRIIEASKSVEEDVEDDHLVTVTTFDSFDDWSRKTSIYPIQDGLGKNLQEMVLTSKTAEFHFDRDMCDIAFMFTTSELSRRGAILQGIENVFLCRYYEDGNEVLDGELVPFPSMINECPVPQCFVARVFLDIETLLSQIYADLNRRGEQQGQLAKTFNNIPFAWESWAYLKFKLHDGCGIPVHTLGNRYFLHRLTHDLKRMKCAVSEDVDVMRFSTETQFDSLRSVLGSNICYGIRARRAKLSDAAPIRIPPDCAVNCVTEHTVESDEDTADPPKFVRVPPAREGGFDLIHNRINMLSLRVRYKKFHYQTEDGVSVPLEDCDLPQHFVDILKPLNWGYWTPDEPASIKIGDMFDHDHRVFKVTEVHDDNIRARNAFLINEVSITFADLDYVIKAIERKRGVGN
jgi:hypothetical protein